MPFKLYISFLLVRGEYIFVINMRLLMDVFQALVLRM